MDSDYIKMCVANYFRYARQCPVVAVEYWAREDGGVQPDVLVLDKANRPIEIEVKVSVSDFRADAKKHIWRLRDSGHRWPWQFWYAVPVEIEDKVKPLLRDGCGLLRVSDSGCYAMQPQRAVSVSVTAPKHKEHEQVDEHRMKRIIAAQSATVCRLLRLLECRKARAE